MTASPEAACNIPLRRERRTAGERGNVKRGTKKSRKALMDLLSEDKPEATAIENVKLSDAKERALRMQEKEVAYSSISNLCRK